MMKNPPHPGECLRDSVKATGWTIGETARCLDVSRHTLSRLLNGRIGISPAIALALENIGWSNAEFWMRVQASYDLAQEKLRREEIASLHSALQETNQQHADQLEVR